MKNKKKTITKPRNWIAVRAHSRSGAGHHNSKAKYSRSNNKKQIRQAKRDL
jgi:hypothetical protein